MNRRVLLATLIAFVVAGLALSADAQRRTEPFVIGPEASVGYVVGHCADGDFDVLSDYIFLMKGMDRYDKSGQFVTEVFHFKLIGESVYYNSKNPDRAVSGGPGEVENYGFDPKTGFWKGGGLSFKVRVPGYGLIFSETGHWVWDPNTGGYLFESGHNQFYEQDLVALCDYLK